MISWLTRLIKGVIIALGFILPGVSGGVLASILGLYERIISFLAHLSKDFVKNVLFFIPVGIGGILGIALFSAPLEYLLEHYQVPVLWAFTGTIVGTLPSLFSESTQKSRRDSKDWIWLLGTFIISGLLLFFLNDLYDRLIYMKDGTIERVFSQGELTENDCKKYGLRAISYKSLKTQNLGAEQEKAASIVDLSINIGKQELIKNLSFDLHYGEIMAIIGKNGIGKTTLGRTLAGLIKNKGKISYGKTTKERLKQSYYMMQDVDYQIFFDTVENELIPKNKVKDSEYLKEVTTYIHAIDLWDKKMDHPQELSGGQKQRLALATAFLSERKIIILDEPTSGLDYKRMKEIGAMIRKYAAKRPVVIITHDLELLFEVCNTVLMLDDKSYKKLPVKGNEGKISDFLFAPIR